MENMDTENYSPRKLLLGELVEVRQKEIGLRGSWHPARVVRVKHARRVVEYDDLLAPDQSKKLCESIHISNDVKLLSATLRLKNGMKTELQKRGFIRPRPPPCSTPPPKNWKQGLLVDAFYDGAWWEGILLDDVHFYHTHSKFKVFFPEEGDELGFLINDLRVSQEWDEDSGQWAIRGYWLLQNETGKIDLSSLKDICRKGRSFSKSLWRRKRFNALEVLQGEECQDIQFACTSISQKQLGSFAGDGDDACQGLRTFAQDNTTKQEDAATNLASSDEHLGRSVQSSSCPMSSEGHACFVKAGFHRKNGKVAIFEADQRFTSGSLEQEDKEDIFRERPSAHATEQESSKEQGVSNAKLKKTGQRKDRAGENSRASCRITRSSLTSSLVNQESDILPLSRLCDTAERSSRNALEDKDMPQEEESGQGLQSSKISLQSSKTTSMNDVSSNAVQADCKSNGCLSAKGGSCLLSHENQAICINNNSRGNGAVFADCSIPHKVRVRQARLAAKQFLMNAGWKLDVRNRARGPLIKQEVVYISPSGSRFFSLAAACRGWKARELHDEFLDRGSNKEFELLSVYCMAENVRCSQKLSSGQTKAEQMLSSSLQESDGKVPLPSAGCHVSGVVENAMNVVDRKSVDPSSFTNVEGSNFVVVDTRVKKKKLRQNGESQKKRKIEVLDGFSHSEIKRKRGRQSFKRGGCRMQVLLTYPGKSKHLNSCKNIGESFQFKKSTVLSWLMDKGILKENEPVSYINRKDGHVMKKGQVTREGVICDCCKEVFTLSNFEAHAGSKLHRPSANTFLDDGRSISDCQLEACAFQDVKEKESLMEINDDTCGVCGDGGELVLCDHCPSTFHADCIGLEVIPEGDWYCPRCCCGICGSNQFSAHDIDDVVHRCAQCELEYHLICAQEHTVLATPAAKASTWFCDRKCKEIFSALRTLVGISNHMENGFSWTLLRSMKKDQGLSPSNLEEMAEHHSKLSVAHGVMQECFVPMIDPRTNINLLSQAIYNRRSRVMRLNYSGFYTIVLERGDEIISVATIRVHGARLAEMPLVGTRYQYRRQGMCRRLMHALEEMLRSIGVEKLILPAVPELLDTWMGAFRFMKLSPQEQRELSKLSLMTFPGTTLLQKYLPAGTQANGSACLPYFVNKVGHNQSPPFKSIEAFLSMARASLDSSALDDGKASLAGAHSGEGSSAKPDVGKNIPQSVGSFMSADPQTPVTLEASKSKNRLKSAHLESSGDGLISKIQKDDDIYTSVIIATTRSNRLVKSRRWVADGLKELKIAKQSKRKMLKLFISAVGTVRSNSQDTLGQHESSTDHTDWDDFYYSGSYCIDGLHVDQPSLDIQIEDELLICPNFYSRRKKRESIHANSTRDFTEKVTVEEQTFCASVEGSQGLRTSLIVSEGLSGLRGGITS
ncbi:hypothetical protein GOP47_0013668 [Adiantum capillus-veneris]|uniref:Uncharacterized protein n=1 Tax=Adiantum capillus-veneris TaxID=13818 RepID=A0A9D4UPG3_ADICA|nr:hypothetical protein GOP47_0013668 [Adiantum capillus-veneris]